METEIQTIYRNRRPEAFLRKYAANLQDNNHEEERFH